MEAYELDDVDRRLLGLLEENARYTAIELAEEIGVSDNTIHNRMDRLEEASVVEGYRAVVDLERTGLSLDFIFVATARISDRARVAEEALALPPVVSVVELMTGNRNLLIRVIGADDEDISAVAERLDQLDLVIDDENLIKAEHDRPLDHEALGQQLE